MEYFIDNLALLVLVCTIVWIALNIIYHLRLDKNFKALNVAKNAAFQDLIKCQIIKVYRNTLIKQLKYLKNSHGNVSLSKVEDLINIEAERLIKCYNGKRQR